jgi:hypothetical protein
MPFALLAQQHYPDTLLLKNGKTYPCFITELDKNSIKIKYNNGLSSTFIYSVDRLILENRGLVYENEKGFLADESQISEFISARNLQYADLQVIPEIEEAGSEIIDTANIKWSFGTMYIPGYFISTYLQYYDYSDYIYRTYLITQHSQLYEGSFSFFINNHFAVKAEIGYTSLNTSEEEIETYRSEQFPEDNDREHYKYSDINSSYFLNVSLMYYITELRENKTSPFVFIGIGKQFADMRTKYVDYNAQPNPDYSSVNNSDKFNEDLNSPWNFSLGFGAEYMINEALSLNAILRVRHVMTEGTYKRMTINPDYSIDYSRKIEEGETTTEVGFGLNFYMD